MRTREVSMFSSDSWIARRALFSCACRRGEAGRRMKGEIFEYKVRARCQKWSLLHTLLL